MFRQISFKPLAGRSFLGHKSLSGLGKRFLSDDAPMSDYEKKIYNLLDKKFKPEELDVRDISGGCGSMFAITVVSDAFNGLTMVKQHKLVNAALADEIKQWHGLQLRTKFGAKNK